MFSIILSRTTYSCELCGFVNEGAVRQDDKCLNVAGLHLHLTVKSGFVSFYKLTPSQNVRNNLKFLVRPVMPLMSP